MNSQLKATTEIRNTLYSPTKVGSNTTLILTMNSDETIKSTPLQIVSFALKSFTNNNKGEICFAVYQFHKNIGSH